MSEREQLPPPAHNLPVPGYYIHAPQPELTPPKTQGVAVSHYLWILRRQLWKIVLFVAASVVVTFIISSRITPVYESTAVINVDRQSPTAVIGPESFDRMYDSEQFLETQVDLIQSDAVLRPVAQKYHLVLGKQSPDADPLDAQAPIYLTGLGVGRRTNTYLLLISYRSPDRRLAAEVANAIAQSYLQHTYAIRIRSSADLSSFMEQQMEELKVKMERSRQALSAFEKELGVINREEKTNILSARVLELITEYTRAQGDRVRKEAIWNSVKTGSLESVQVSGQAEQLTQTFQRLNEARQRLSEIKTTYGSSHPEYRKAASQVVELTRQFDEARSNITQRVEADYNQSLNRERMLQKAVADAKAESDRLNARSFEYQELKREAEADRKLYGELVRKIKEAGINAGFQNDNIRIADAARPARFPVYPNVRRNVLLALLFSIALAAGAAVFIDILDTTVRDPEQVSRYLGTDVIATLPMVKSADMVLARTNEVPPAAGNVLAGVGMPSRRNGNGNNNGYYRSISSYEEAVRTLRNTVLLGDFETRINSLLITSAVPGEGKSTTAIHLAVAHAEQGKKTLLVDADLRRPSLHRRFNMTPPTGLSDVLIAGVPWKTAIQSIPGKPNLFFLPSGPPSHRASDVIGPRMADLVDEFAKEFDLTILDSPPLLAFAEPLQMATTVDGILIVSRAGHTKRKAVSDVISTLNRLRANVLGVVLNQVKPDTSDAYSYHGYYGDKQDEGK